MFIVNFLFYASAILLILLIIYLIVSLFPKINRSINLFKRETPLYEKITFYISSIISIVSLLIALKTYDDAFSASQNQNKVNDSTRVALEKVVNLIDKQTQTSEKSRNALENVVKLSENGLKISSAQQKILNSNLKVSEEELKTIKDKNNEERIKNSYMPDLQITLIVDSIEYKENNLVKIDGNNWLKIKLKHQWLNKKVPMTISLSNAGKTSAKGTLMLITPLTGKSSSIEKISGQNPPNDHVNNRLNVDIAEFYDYYSLEIPIAKKNFVSSPEYRFNFIPTENISVFRVDIDTVNGLNKMFVLYIELE